MDTRDAILDATLRLFAELGSRGATTRRIAEAAGVNEVTIFRHFGSKDALLDEALRVAGQRALAVQLPAEPVAPEEELVAWCTAHLAALHSARSLVRTSMGEVEENESARRIACEVPLRIHAELRDYLAALQARGLARDDVALDVAASLLMGTVLSDALTRDLMPERFPFSMAEGAREYVRLFLRSMEVQ